jgi:peptide-methionine (S)-S-oxide reductase
MMTFFSRGRLVVFGMLVCAGLFSYVSESPATELPNPVVDQVPLPPGTSQTIVFAGGCFWGVEAVFDHVKGVTKAISGYAGGAASTAKYDDVSTGTTGHAESVQVTYDPSVITFGQLLKVYFTVAHDPTELNRQGPDTGTQYRSEIFFTTPEQQQVANAYIAQLGVAKVFPDPIVTKVEPLDTFYPAEPYHQDFAARHPDNAYIVINDAPKVVNLKKQFPELYVQK